MTSRIKYSKSKLLDGTPTLLVDLVNWQTKFDSHILALLNILLLTDRYKTAI